MPWAPMAGCSAVATGKSDRGLRHCLAAHGIADRFVTLQTADRNPSKPHPAMALAAMAEAGAAPGATVFIGDTGWDMGCARAAGCGAIGVGWGYHDHDEMIAMGAHDVADSPAEIAALANKWVARMTDDAMWKRRFFALMLARLSGTVLALLGLVVGFSDVVRPGGCRALGILLVVAGADRPGRRCPSSSAAAGASREAVLDRGRDRRGRRRLGNRARRASAQDPRARHAGGRSLPLAEAIAEEWRACGEEIDPRAMPLTGLANAAIDHVAPEPARVRRRPCALRRGRPALLSRRPSAQAGRGAGGGMGSPAGLGAAAVRRRVHRRHRDHARSAAAGDHRRAWRRARPATPFELAALSPIVTIGGSLITALALFERAIDLDTAWDAVTVDDRWQLDQWGADDEAVAALANRRADFAAAARFLELA